MYGSALSDMLKMLFIPYIVIFGLRFALFKSDTAGFLLMTLAFLLTIGINLSLFYRDYVGKNALLINSLPIIGFIKVFRKLVYTICFFAIFVVIFYLVSTESFRSDYEYLIGFAFELSISFVLVGYSAIAIFKRFGIRYFMLCGLVLFEVVNVALTAVAHWHLSSFCFVAFFCGWSILHFALACIFLD